MIAGIVLAGGGSERMGQVKALLSAGERTFVEAAIATLLRGGCSEVIVVLNDASAELLDVIARAGGVLTWGAGPGTEQIDSLVSGLRALPPEVEAVIVLPVDHPKVKPQTVAALIAAFEKDGAAIIQCRYGEEHGHPVLFAASLFDELCSGRHPDGARTVIEAHRAEAREVVVSDPGVLADVDTPGDYRQEFGEAP
jgi:CTP:molybdopterin cytidylyltransferase MocA